MSRLALAKEAVRPMLKGRVMLAGPAGAGKTRTALIIAEVLAEGGPVLMIDTERESALTYADDFTFTHLPWAPPFDPRELTPDILEAGQSNEVIIVDSGSHFWRADGGTLDIANGKFTGWKEARPAQEDLVQAILTTDAHVIFCTRSKMKHEQVIEDGKHVVKKLGVGPIQDDDLEYEVNVSLALDLGHTLTVMKSRTTALPVGRDFKPGHAKDMAELYRDWLKQGEPPVDRGVIDKLVERMNALPPPARSGVKQEFVATIGRPEHLRESQLDAAVELIHSWEQRSNGHTNTPTEGAGDDGPVSGGDAAPSGDGADGHDVGRPGPEPAPATQKGEGVEPSPNGTAPTPARKAVGKKDVGALADVVFLGDAANAKPGKKVAAKKALRYALTYALTEGKAQSLDDLDPEGLHQLHDALLSIQAGVTGIAVDFDPAAGVSFAWADGETTVVLWADLSCGAPA